MRSVASDLPLSVLIYPNDELSGWTALALEMDIRSYGDTPESALDELGDLVYVQISFALFKRDPSLIWKRADAIWFDRFAAAFARQQWAHLVLNQDVVLTVDDPPTTMSTGDAAYGLPMPQPHVVAELVRQFQADYA